MKLKIEMGGFPQDLIIVGANKRMLGIPEDLSKYFHLQLEIKNHL